MTLIIRRATPGDLDTVLGLLAQSAAWMHQHGWNAWKPEGFPAWRIRPHIAEGTVWLVSTPDEQPVGTLTLDTRPDPEHVEADLDPVTSQALVLHRLATSRQRRGLGHVLLDWAADHAAEADMAEVWINVARNATPLQAWYLRHGFEYITTVTTTGRKSGWLARRAARRIPGLDDRIKTV